MRNLSSTLIIFVLWLSGLGAAAQFAKVGLVLPELGELYPDAGASLGFLVSSISFVGALLGLAAGAVASQIGMRKLLLAGLTTGSAISLIQAIGLPLPLLLASRVVEGIAHLAVVVSAPTLIALNSSERMRPAAMTLWGTFFGVSFALTAWLGLPLAKTQGINALFFSHGLLMAAIAMMVVVIVPAQSAEATHARPDSLKLATLRQRHIDAWSSPFIAAPAAGWFFYTVTFVALLAVLPTLVHPDQRSFTAAALPIASILFSMTLGVVLLQWVSAIVVVVIGFCSAICISLLLAFTPDAVWASIALFAAMGLIQGASFASVPQLNQRAEQQALANGAMAQAGNIGNALGTPLLLMLLGVGGLNSVIAMIMICYTLAVCAHLILAGRRKRH